MKNLSKLFLGLGTFLSVIIFYPVSVAAASLTCTGEGIGNIICKFQNLLNAIVPVLLALGVVYFVWGVVQYVIAGGEEAKDKGRDKIIYGIIGFAVITSLWGLVNVVVQTFDLDNSVPEVVLLETDSSCTITDGSTLKDVLCYVSSLLNDAVIPLIFAVAVVMFIWGVVQSFILNGDEEAKRAQGRQFMLWGIIALAVMISIWGLVGILQSTLGIRGGSFLPRVRPPGDNGTSVTPTGGGVPYPDPTTSPHDPYDPCVDNSDDSCYGIYPDPAPGPRYNPCDDSPDDPGCGLN